MSTIQSRTTEKKGKNPVILTRKFPWKSSSTPHLPFLSTYPKILKEFPKTSPTKMNPTKWPEKGKNEARKSKEEGRKQSEKKTSSISKLYFLRMSELRQLIFCIWIRRPRMYDLQTALCLALALYSQTVTRKPPNYAFFGKIHEGEWAKNAYFVIWF